MARQDSKITWQVKVLEESRDAKHAYSLKAYTERPCHVIRMLRSDFQRKFSSENYKRESAFNVARGLIED